MKSMSKRIVITINAAWNVANFRTGLIRSLQEQGLEVIAIAPEDRHVSTISKLGCKFYPLRMDVHGTNPLKDIYLIWQYYRLLRRLRPDAVLAYTIKPNIYGSLAAGMLGIPVINNIAGLGSTFLGSRWLNRIAVALYRLALARSATIFFQNEDDMRVFIGAGILSTERARLLPGSGVDVARFAPMSTAISPRPFRFLLMGRLLGDKGVREYVSAARRLRSEGSEIEAALLGFLDVKSPSAISKTELARWVDDGDVVYLGEADDVRGFIASADCVVLPSYREGTPRSLLEAASMGKPIITTNVPGCRDTVIDGVSGYLVAAKDVTALTAAMRVVSTSPKTVRDAMGAAGRAMVIAKYSETRVLQAYSEALARLFH